MYIQPGSLSKKVTSRAKHKIIEHNLAELSVAGVNDVPKSHDFGSNQSANCMGNATKKNNIGLVDDGDEDYVQPDVEEGQSFDSENDDLSRSQANKVKETGPRKKKVCSTAQALSIPGATQAEQLPTSPIEQVEMSQNLKRKRGRTKLETIAIDGGDRVEVMFDENGQPIGEGSVKLSSFLGPLVREIVPYTLSDWRKLPYGMAEVLWQSVKVRFNLHEEWHRRMVFQKMNEDWRASKSIFVKKVRNASNEEERLNLKPDNVKSLHDWKDFVKEKTSAKFKERSNIFKEMRKKQLELPHTMSRKGYARLKADLKAKKVASISRVAVWAHGHRRKNGQPATKYIGQKIEEMEKIESNEPNSSPTDIKEDAVSQVLGVEKHGRLRTFGKGITLTRLTVSSPMDGKSDQLLEENLLSKSRMGNGKFDQVLEENLLSKSQMANDKFDQVLEENLLLKSQMAEMQRSIAELKKSQFHNPATTKGPPMTPIVSPLVESPPPNTDHNTKCKLLDWMGMGEVVAEGRWASSDPSALVHFIPIGPNAMKVWVDVAKKAKVHLWWPSSDMTYVEDAVGTTVAWPADKVIMDSSLGSLQGGELDSQDLGLDSQDLGLESQDVGMDSEDIGMEDEEVDIVSP